MDRKKFKAEFDKMSNDYDPAFLAMKRNTLEESVVMSPPIDMEGAYNLVVAMEELAELSQEISKTLRGKYNEIGMIEEIADALVGIDYIKELLGISQADIDKAVKVKIKRLRKHMDEDKKML